MKVVLGLALLGLASLGAAEHQLGDTAVTKTRSVTKLAEGVYMIRHTDAPNTFPQGNTSSTRTGISTTRWVTAFTLQQILA